MYRNQIMYFELERPYPCFEPELQNLAGYLAGYLVGLLQVDLKIFVNHQQVLAKVKIKLTQLDQQHALLLLTIQLANRANQISRQLTQTRARHCSVPPAKAYSLAYLPYQQNQNTNSQFIRIFCGIDAFLKLLSFSAKVGLIHFN